MPIEKEEACFFEMEVRAGETFDFSANLSIRSAATPTNGKFAARLKQLGKFTAVATAVHDYGNNNNWRGNNSLTVLYRAQLQEDATFYLCYDVDTLLVGREFT